jgi:hypothetical protein
VILPYREALGDLVTGKDGEEILPALYIVGN